MAHLSGNPTWQDWPSTATLVTAAGLEAIEGAIDGMSASATPPVCEVRLVTAFTPAAVTDILAQSGWATHVDTANMVRLNPAAGTYTHIEIPNGWGGRYRLHYHATSTIGAGGTHAIKITRNSIAIPNSVATAVAGRTAAGADGAVVDAITEIVLAAGDRIYWGNFLSVSAPIVPSISGINVPTAMTARYVGPA